MVAISRAGVFVHGFISLGFGSVIVCFLFPATQLRTLGRVNQERAFELVGAGMVFVALGAVLSYSLWLG